MKRLMIATTFLLIAAAMPVSAKELKCQGELYRATPPVPNHPTHIRNVVWRNTQFLRDACQNQATKAMSSGTVESNKTGETSK